jgi:hypothetical protein
MIGHTKGPWDWATKLSGSENHRGFRVGKDKSWLVADVMPIDSDGKEGAANARLIAAAPELLEALRALCAHPSVNDGDVPSPLYDAAIDAIAKATGETE